MNARPTAPYYARATEPLRSEESRFNRDSSASCQFRNRKLPGECKMSDKTEPSVEMNEGMPAPANASKKKTVEERNEARRRYVLSLRAPEAPLMLSTRQAWKRLCAQTGGSVAKSTFVRWIRDGKIPAVRLGRNIFVPIPIMEKLIEQCLNGDPFI